MSQASGRSSRRARVGRAFGWGALLLAALALALWAFRPRPPRAPARAASAQELEAYLRALVRFGRPPGLSLAVISDGRLVYGRGFGVADGPRHVPADADTIYRWWSLTKIPTAIAVLQLEERGALTLDDPVTRHVPFFRVHDAAGGTPIVTVRQLLNHSSGLPDAGRDLFRWLHLPSEPPVEQTAFVRRVLPRYARLAFAPGSRTSYSNVGYWVLGAVIEKASGEHYEDYVRGHILRPLEMTRTDFLYTSAMTNDCAAGSHPLLDPLTPLLPLAVEHWSALYREREGTRLWLETVYTDYTPSTGLIGPAPDLTRLLRAYLNAGALDGARILAPDSVETMSRASRLPGRRAGLQQGLGWVVGCGARECLQHLGGGPGFGTGMRIYPRERLGLVVLTNDATTDTTALLDLISSVPWSRAGRPVAETTHAPSRQGPALCSRHAAIAAADELPARAGQAEVGLPAQPPG